MERGTAVHLIIVLTLGILTPNPAPNPYQNVIMMLTSESCCRGSIKTGSKSRHSRSCVYIGSTSGT